MQQKIVACVFVATVIVLFAAPAYAVPPHEFLLTGKVLCDVDADGKYDPAVDTPLVGVLVTVENVGSDTTDGEGAFDILLPDSISWYTVDLGELPVDPTSISPPVPHGYLPGPELIFLVESPDCSGEAGGCWLTGGGVKFSSITGTRLAEKGPKHNFGGNVFPSCSPEPGDGGQWNHISHSDVYNGPWHFQGWSIDRVVCGNVEDPEVEPGSESPVTPYNFIEFEGTGTLKGIKGNKMSYDEVRFFARAEDRNEPGSGGAKDGVDIDRYFLHVWDPGSGATLLLVDDNGEPITITGGNLQLHISSCDNPPLN
jgi:hypothetical protein